jgi:hypothetical protein
MLYLYAELGTSLFETEWTLKSDEWSLLFWAKENECRAMSELSRKRVRTSLKAIAQFKRARILRSSLSERWNHVKFSGALYSKNTCGLGKKFHKRKRPNLTKIPVKFPKIMKKGIRYCLMKTEGGGEWYQSIHFDKLSCRQVSFSGPKGMASREYHKTEQSLIGVE